MGNFTKRSAAVVAGSVLAVAGGTAAFAYAQGWFSGNGTVYAASSSILPVRATANLGSTTTSRLYPGKTVAITSASLNNPNDYPVQVTEIAISNVTSNKQGCGAGEAKLEFGAVPAGTTVASGTTATAVSLGSITMDEEALPVCAGAVFTITANLTGGIADAAGSGSGSGSAPGTGAGAGN
ncbi:hypothetical protein [Actinoplanes utahensis]|uniref:SipW-cognate class signal peptide n=1 Tax=Actinoplanes utahensis TaxID=1869 RepID=A0A0A6UB87_ACTUT|nr:hypothetical protein [Actinoplanes utahensis]KHD72756.1 hypothetical protein MB27_40895 [Actinoplanes utahensis]GIF29059.1 hypothetical protein Aut01nite_20450 [Actinoplanes utahensis]